MFGYHQIWILSYFELFLNRYQLIISLIQRQYALVAIASALIITPCEVLSIRKASNPGKARALTNMNAIILILVSMYVLKTEKITPTKIVGLLFFGLGMFMIF